MSYLVIAIANCTLTRFHNRPGNCEHWLPLCRPPRWWKALWSSWTWVYTV